MRTSHVLPLLLACALAPFARADVLTVDDDGPADFPALQPAIDAALSGDVLLVAPGNYQGFVVDGKALAILASMTNPSQRPLIHSGIVVRHVAAGQTLLVDGLVADTVGAQGVDALHVEDCAGSVRVAHTVLHGFIAAPGGVAPGSAGLSALHATDVVVTDSVLIGASGDIADPVAPPGGTGLLAEDARVSVWNSSVLGGFGGGNDSVFVASGDGGPAVHVVSGRVVIEGGYVAGGNGPFGNITTSAGGAGLLVEAGAEAWVRGADVFGGAGGYLFVGPFFDQGPDGPVSAGDGAVLALDGEPSLLTLVSPTAVAPGAIVRLKGSGSGLLLAGLQGSNALLPAWSAPLHVGGSPVLLAIGGFPLVTALPPLPAGFGEQMLHLQLIASTHELSSPVVMVLAETLP